MSSTHQLIYSATSPFARKVRIAALEKKIQFELVQDVPWNDNTKVPDFNPMGQVPVWVTETKDSIYDSRVIVEYLELVGGPSLYPKDPWQRIQSKKIEALADGMTDSLVSLFIERNKRAKETQSSWWIDRQFGKVQLGLTALSEQLKSQKYFVGTELTVADIGVTCLLGYLQLRFQQDVAWEKQHPKLSQFYHSMLERPSVRESAPPI